MAYKDATTAHLATRLGQLTLSLRQSAINDCTRLSFEIAPDTDFAAARKFLAAEGIPNEKIGRAHV